MSKRVKPLPCIFCGASRVYPDAIGTPWENRCTVCGWNQVEDGWFRQMWQLPMETELALQCPFYYICGPNREEGDRLRCTHLHTFTVEQLLGASYHAQFRCPRCDTWGVGKELIRNNKAFLRYLILDTVPQEEAPANEARDEGRTT